MRMNVMSFIRKALKDERGQALPWMILGMVGLLGVSGFTIDAGHAYVVRSQLQNAANAAALAAAGNVYNTSSTNNATTIAGQYAGSSGDLNSNTSLVTATTTVTTKCLNLLMPKGSTCGTGSPANAVQVTETATMPTFFMKVLGISTIPVAAQATASMQGSAQPWNVAIILDATPSMNSTDPYCTQSGSTAEQCALTGIQTMLKGINPCNGGASNCSASSANSNFRVSLFSFPNVTTTTVKYDYQCGGTPTEEAYTLPVIPASWSTTAYAPFAYTGASGFTATYQITPPGVGNADANGFLSDYYQVSGTNGLNSSSILVKAVGNGSTNGCLKPPTGFSGGGGQTYFAGAIYAAQTALQAEQAAVTTLGIPSKNAIIFVSDGQANTLYNRYPQKTSTAGTGGISVTYAGSSSKNLTGTANTFGQYPDFNDDCQQAIMAAQYAINAGTRFYAVSYGSESNGCTSSTGGSESSVVVTGSLNVPITSVSQVVPCVVMEDMASPGQTSASPWYFYTEGSSIHNGCSDTSHTSSDLNAIFGAIVSTFTTPRLLPNNAT